MAGVRLVGEDVGSMVLQKEESLTKYTGNELRVQVEDFVQNPINANAATRRGKHNTTQEPKLKRRPVRNFAGPVMDVSSQHARVRASPCRALEPNMAAGAKERKCHTLGVCLLRAIRKTDRPKRLSGAKDSAASNGASA